jgi:hypothetical protein
LPSHSLTAVAVNSGQAPALVRGASQPNPNIRAGLVFGGQVSLAHHRSTALRGTHCDAGPGVVRENLGVSERRACHVLGQARATQRYAARGPPMDYRENPQCRARRQPRWTDFTPPWWTGFTPPLTFSQKGRKGSDELLVSIVLRVTKE